MRVAAGIDVDRLDDGVVEHLAEAMFSAPSVTVAGNDFVISDALPACA